MLHDMEQCIDLELAGHNVLCAVSGGPDSMFLLYALNTLASKYDFSIYAIHVNHQIRQHEAMRDQKFVEDICQKWKIPIDVVCRNVPAIAKEERLSLETAGRNIRRQACLDIAKKHNCQYIALGHHANDQAETVLMNLVRGSGLKGLSGMQVYLKPWWRPLLMFSRNDIEQAVQTLEIPFVIDSTNQDERFTRNRFRKILFDLEKEQPKLIEHIARTACFLSEDEQYLQEMASVQLEQLTDPSGIDAQKLLQLPPSIAKRVLQQAMQHHGIMTNVSYQHIQMIMDGCLKAQNAQWDLPHDFIATLDYGRLSFYQRNDTKLISEQYNIDVDCEITTPWGKFCCVSNENDLKNTEYINEMIFLDSSLMDHAFIRNRRSGDRIALKGMQGRKKIQDFFVDRKVQKSLRNGPMLLYKDDSTVLWIVGYAHDRRCSKFRENPDQVCLVFYKNAIDINIESEEVKPL